MDIKIENKQMLIPNAWKPTFVAIVECIINLDFIGLACIEGVERLSNEVEQQIKDSIQDYGEVLVALPNETWKSSLCSWQKTYWDVVLDLFTEEGESDLALRVRVYESEAFYRFYITGVYVP